MREFNKQFKMEFTDRELLDIKYIKFDTANMFREKIHPESAVRKYNINVTTHNHFICEHWQMLDIQGVCDGFRADKIIVPDCPTKEVFKGRAGKILINGKEQ